MDEYEQMERDLADMMRAGVICAMLDDGVVKFIHHVHVHMYPDARWLTLAEVARLDNWYWWFESN